MADYIITGPDGQKYKMTADNDAAIQHAVQQMFGGGEAPASAGESFAKGTARGVTLGLADEAKAAVQSAIPGVINAANKKLFDVPEWFPSWLKAKPETEQNALSTASDYGQRYNENLTKIRTQDKAAAEANPISDAAGSVAGNIALFGPLMRAAPGLTSTGPSLLANTAKMAGVGGVMAGVQGFNEGEDGFANRVGSAVVPAAAGAVIGGAMPLAGAAAQRFMETAPGRALSENVVSPLARKMASMMGDAPVAKSLSAAAAPDGSPGLMSQAPSQFTQIADRAQNAAETGAVRRLTTALQRSGLSPDDVRTQGARLGPEYTFADIDPQFLSAARTANTMPGQTRSVAKATLEGRDRNAGYRLVEAFNGGEPAPSAFALRGEGQAFDTWAKDVGRTAYGAMDEAGFKNSPGISRLMTENPKVAAAVDRVLASEKAARAGTDRAPASVVDIMHKVKREIQANGLENGIPTSTAYYWNQTADDFVKALKGANPELAAADRAFAQAKSLPEYFDAGANLLARESASPAGIEKSAPALTEMLKGANPQQVLAARTGATNAARAQAEDSTRLARALAQRIDESGPVRTKLDQLYGPDWARRITQQAAAEKRFAETSNELLRGSKTADKTAEIVGEGVGSAPVNVAGGSITSRMWDALAGTINKLTAANEPVRDVIGRATLNMNPSEKERFLRLIADELARRQQASPLAASIAGVSGSSLTPSNR